MGTTSAGDFRGWSLTNVVVPESGMVSLLVVLGGVLVTRRARPVM
jgi:hypothetical protein